jgi:hypothetical protein
MSDNLVLKSGREIYANQGIFGIDADLCVSTGYDNGVEWPADSDDPDALTADDMREIADLMLDRWTRFRASLGE